MAVVVALSMVAVLGFVAIAVDLGSIYSNEQQLQNGADAGALAIAESCQRGSCVDTADKYAKANKLDGQATGTAVIDTSAGKVTVTTASTHQNWFAAALGQSTTAISAKATATWGFPSGGAVLPLAISQCDFFHALGTWSGNPNPAGNPVVITLTEHTCTPPAHNEVPGGFGELSGTNCLTTVVAGNWVLSDPGNNGPNSCTNFDWSSIVNTNKPVLLPIFDGYKGTGSNAQYQIAGLAAFILSGVCFSSQAQWPTNMSDCPNNKRIEGKFVSYTILNGSYIVDPNATQFGGGVVTLTS